MLHFLEQGGTAERTTAPPNVLVTGASKSGITTIVEALLASSHE